MFFRCMTYTVYRSFAASSDGASSASVQTKSSTFGAAVNLERISSWSVRDVVDFVSLVPGCNRYAEVNH